MEKLLEHLRQVHLTLVVVVTAMSYFAMASWFDASDVQRESDDLVRLVLLLKRVEAKEEVRKRFDPVELQQTSVVDEASHIRLILRVKENLRHCLGVAPDLDDIWRIIPWTKVQVDGHIPYPYWPLAQVHDDLSKLRFIWQIPVAQCDKSGSARSGKVELVDRSPQVGVSEIRFKVGGEPTAINVTWVTERSEMSPTFKDRFPLLHSQIARWGNQPIDRYLRLVRTGAAGNGEKKAKVFDLEIAGRHVSAVFSLASVIILLYLVSYLADAVRLAPSVGVQSRDLGAIWIGTHSNHLAAFVPLSLLMAPAGILASNLQALVDHDPQAWILGGVLTVVALGLAWSALKLQVRLRRALNSAWQPERALPH